MNKNPKWLVLWAKDKSKLSLRQIIKFCIITKSKINGLTATDIVILNGLWKSYFDIIGISLNLYGSSERFVKLFLKKLNSYFKFYFNYFISIILLTFLKWLFFLIFRAYFKGMNFIFTCWIKKALEKGPLENNTFYIRASWDSRNLNSCPLGCFIVPLHKIFKTQLWENTFLVEAVNSGETTTDLENLKFYKEFLLSITSGKYNVQV